MLEPEIIYEDDQIIVLSKPFGLVVNQAETAPDFTLQSWLNNRFASFSEYQGKSEYREFLSRSGIVHRLDRETSGVMVSTKTQAAFKHLKKQFKNREVNKNYLALVHGNVEVRKGHIRLPLARNPENRLRYTVRIEGKMAETYYQVINHYKKEGKSYTYISVFPKTGRTHQIRVHFKYLRRPLVTDSLYLGEKRYQQDREWCPRLFLHAENLKFKHPETEEQVSFQVQLTPSLKHVLSDELDLID
jgi:23S rRNA pseudouridine1911/1915/1917 synthase